MDAVVDPEPEQHEPECGRHQVERTEHDGRDASRPRHRHQQRQAQQNGRHRRPQQLARHDAEHEPAPGACLDRLVEEVQDDGQKHGEHAAAERLLDVARDRAHLDGLAQQAPGRRHHHVGTVAAGLHRHDQAVDVLVEALDEADVRLRAGRREAEDERRRVRAREVLGERDLREVALELVLLGALCRGGAVVVRREEADP